MRCTAGRCVLLLLWWWLLFSFAIVLLRQQRKMGGGEGLLGGSGATQTTNAHPDHAVADIAVLKASKATLHGVRTAIQLEVRCVLR